MALGITGSAGGHELSQRLAKVETAIFRRKTIVFDYFTMERGDLNTRKVDPYQLLFQGGQFYLVGHSHERGAIRVFRLSRIRGKVGYATKAEHDFQRPAGFDPRAYANRIDWQFGDPVGTAEVWIGRRIAWQIERHFGRYGEMRAGEEDGDRVFVTPYANARQLIAWVLGLGENARIVGPPELADELRDRVTLLVERHTGEPSIAPTVDASAAAPTGADRAAPDAGNGHHPDGAIRPERFARLVTLASILIDAGRAGRLVDAKELCTTLKISDQELREDISVLNLVNFGAGTYVLYAELGADGMIEIDPEPYGDSFARPARLLPVEAKALVAAIDLIGEHIPEGSLTSVREKVVAALGEDPVHEGLQIATPGGDDAEIAAVVSSAIAGRRLLSFEYYKENEDEFSYAQGRAVRADQRPRGLVRRHLRPLARRRAALPPGPLQVRQRERRVVRAAPRRRSRGRRRRLAADRRGARLAPGPRVDLARARALGPRGAPDHRRTRGRRGRGRARLREHATISCATCSRRPATRSCSSPRTPATPSATPPRRSARRRTR